MACGSNSNLSLYVGDLSPEVNEANLFQIFSKIGEVTHIRVCRDRDTKKSRGYAFVTFKRHEDSKEAFNKLNYEPILGKPCRIMWQERDHSKRRLGLGNVYIKNFDKNVDSRALYKLFSEFGNILSCKVATDKRGESQGFGFVHFDKAEDGKRAIEKMHGKLLNNNQLFVCKFKGREDTQSQEKKKEDSSEPPPGLNSHPVLSVKLYPKLDKDIHDQPILRDKETLCERSLQSVRGDEVLSERQSLRDRYAREEIRPNADRHPEEPRFNSRRRYAERLRNSRSVPRGHRRIGTGDLEKHLSDESDDDLDKGDLDKDVLDKDNIDKDVLVSVVTDMISEVAKGEHPNEANLIVRLILEKCDEGGLSLLLGSRTLLENEVEKAHMKIKRLESPRIDKKKQ